MALPPERVSIKRKRDTESVDVLFIQDSKRQRKQFVFRRVGPDQTTVNAFSTKSHGNSSEGQDETRQSTENTQASNLRPKIAPRPRQFHLERPSSQSGSVSKAVNSRDPYNNRKLAVLVENSLKRHRPVDAALDVASRGRSVQQSLPPSPKKSLLEGPKQEQQLRPRASAAELRWREEKWGPRGSVSRSVSRGPTPTSFDPQEMKLARSLDAFALEQESKPSPGANNTPTISSPRKKPLKFQPKSSAAGRKLSMGQNNRKAGNSDESESEYEYDTYERVPYQAAPSESATTTNDKMDVDAINLDPTLDGKSIGVLVIADEDEDLWASYQELDDSDAEFNTDDEDENAEDYYGNDYPEDELESDDEYNRGAYNYRYTGSDDEHYGDGLDDEERAYSDDEALPSQSTGVHESGSFMSPVQHGGLHPY